MRARWTALVRCFDDGRLALDNNPAERALRWLPWPEKLSVRWLRCRRTPRRGDLLLIESAKLNALNPQHHIADVLARTAEHPARRIAELLPWNWQPADTTRTAA
jgi:hypothetical protein